MGKVFLALSLALGSGAGGLPAVVALAAAPANGNDSSAAQSPADSVSGGTIVQSALRYLGYPYTTVGHSPTEGFSCIGFVSYVYQSNGIPLPDDLQLAMNYAPPVAFSNLLPGDVLFFQNTVWPGLSHTAIYLGGGRFIHAEWYNRGVVISSFNSDPIDGNYWIHKYLGANRPWTGAPTAPVVPQGTSAAANGSGPTATAVTMLSGTPAVVTVPALNVRGGPSKQYSVETVAQQGAHLTVLRRSRGWFRVQLSDGTIGWVVAAGVGGADLPTESVAATAASVARASERATAIIPVGALRVHNAPSLSAPVVAIAKHGEQVSVLKQESGWVRVRLASGVSGWVSAAYLGKISGLPSRPVQGTTKVAVRVHTAPKITAPVVTVAPAGTQVRVLTDRGDWLLVRLPSGTSGYVVSKFVR